MYERVKSATVTTGSQGGSLEVSFEAPLYTPNAAVAEEQLIDVHDAQAGNVRSDDRNRDMPDAILSIPRTFLRQWLGGSEAAPLEPSIRAFMGRAFGADFGDVRIHTGPAAAALCRALHAHAFAFGHDIVFGEGEYSPATSAGRRLLAHELVHVLQQRSAISRPQSLSAPIGAPRDDCENEADRLAKQALGAGLQSAVTPDPAGAIRRTVFVGAEGATIKTSHEGATPNLDITIQSSRRVAVLHLTRHKQPIIRGQHQVKASALSAINITGSVPVTADRSDNLEEKYFGFIQLVLEPMATAFYAGRESAEGSVVLNPAADAPHFMLDTSGDRNPYYNDNAPAISRILGTAIAASATMDDHPNWTLPLVVPNSATSKSNYLVRARRDLQFYSVFVVRDRKTWVIQPLAYVYWTATWDARIGWVVRGDDIDVFHVSVDGGFVVSNAIKGPPRDPSLAAMITNPTAEPSEWYNEQAANTLRIMSANPVSTPFLQHIKHWDARMNPNNMFYWLPM